MNCPFDKEKLSGYYDGELDAAEKAEVERHIASCSECLRELGELKSAAILVKELPRLRAPRSIADGVRKEIQAAGKVHSFTRVRRTVMWAASAAAVLFIGLNVIYFAKPASESPVAARPVSAAPALGRAMPAEEAPRAEEMDRLPARRTAPEEQAKTRLDEARKNESADRDRKTPVPPAPTAKAEVEREKAPAAKVEEKKPTSTFADPAAPLPAAEPARPAPTKPAPAPPPAPAAPVTAAPRPEPKPAEPPADKAAPAAKKDGDGQAGLKQKAAEAGPAADVAPTHLTLASTQMAKARPEMADALKRMGLTLPPPPSAAMVKGVARSGAREESVYTYELTDAQIARLRTELEKPGTSMLVTGRPEDPVMAQFKRGGVFEPRKDVASGGAAPAKKFAAADSKTDAPREKEAKEAEDAVGGKPLAEGAPAAEKPGEPRRKVVIHFLEVPYIPDRQPAGDALKK